MCAGYGIKLKSNVFKTRFNFCRAWCREPVRLAKDTTLVNMEDFAFPQIKDHCVTANTLTLKAHFVNTVSDK